MVYYKKIVKYVPVKKGKPRKKMSYAKFKYGKGKRKYRGKW